MSNHTDMVIKRTLSIPRLALLVGVVACVALGLWYGKSSFVNSPNARPWFAAYVDATLTPAFSFQTLGGETAANAVLSFIVATPNAPCVPAWGAAYSLDQANASLSLDARLARLKQRGGEAIVSFGGRDNQELSVGCTDESKLYDAYNGVVERYDSTTIDLDLEGSTLADKDAGERRARVMAKLQADRRASGKAFAVWLTLPATPQGLSEPGTQMVEIFLNAKVDLAGVNVMTMNYGESLQGMSMVEGSVQALTNTHRQLKILYERTGVSLSNATLWSKIGATPMIGQNDLAGEIVTVQGAEALNAFAVQAGIGRMSMWSANRDIACGSNYVNLTRVSNSCSGVPQEREEFMRVLSAGFDGTISSSSELVTAPDAKAEKTTEIIDDPAQSPYQIWTATGVYLEGEKIVWKKNVYQAKWWTQGEVPDNPVLQSWETPWELIGPVLPGDKPIPQATLPAGKYPEWSGTATYNAGQRVVLGGVPYQAKWWTQGDSPAATAVDPNSSPWVPLTQAQINELLKK
ncbi:MAG: chitinase [Patescibacteria group bacterium]